MFFLLGAAGRQFLLLEGEDLVPFPPEFGEVLAVKQEAVPRSAREYLLC